MDYLREHAHFVFSSKTCFERINMYKCGKFVRDMYNMITLIFSQFNHICHAFVRIESRASLHAEWWNVRACSLLKHPSTHSNTKRPLKQVTSNKQTL